MLAIETEDGETIYFQDEHLRAAQVSRIWQPDQKMLRIVLVWQDTGLPGDPMLTVVEDGIEIRTREFPVAAVQEIPGYKKSLADL